MAGLVAVTDLAAGQTKPAMRHYAEDLLVFMRAVTGNDGLTETEAWTAFRALPEDRRNAFVRVVFYRELTAVGKDAAVSKNYNAGYDAIAVMFPDAPNYAGDLSMIYSQVKTMQGGDIDILVPGGRIDAGQTVRPEAWLGIGDPRLWSNPFK